MAREREDGFILATVLWSVLLLSSLALALGLAARLDVQARFAQVELAKSTMLADGLARYAATWYGSVRSGRTVQLPIDGKVCRIQGHGAIIAVRWPIGLIDLNYSSEQRLSQAIASQSNDIQVARRIAAAIADYRDADREERELGAEVEAYRSAGMPYGPKNAQFADVGELDQVLGVNSGLFQALTPLLTVHSFGSEIGWAAAPSIVRGALSAQHRGAARSISTHRPA